MFAEQKEEQYIDGVLESGERDEVGELVESKHEGPWRSCSNIRVLCKKSNLLKWCVQLIKGHTLLSDTNKRI